MKSDDVTWFFAGMHGGNLNKGKRKVERIKTSQERQGRRASRASRRATVLGIKRATVLGVKRAQSVGRNK